ncbi:hypothetical protein [Rhizobium johnstonii]
MSDDDLGSNTSVTYVAQRLIDDIDAPDTIASGTGPIGLTFGPGLWQKKTQLILDEEEQVLIRRAYSVWNCLPASSLDFQWKPDVLAEDAPGPISGSGRLVWRSKGLPSYDRKSTYAEYVGQMDNGRPHGKGTYVDCTGLLYEGQWSEGFPNGQGRLQLATGDEYAGAFRAGRADGEGQYFKGSNLVYVGMFQDGVQSGEITTISSAGFSFQSYWQAGREGIRSGNAQLAQLQDKTEGVTLGIAVERVPADEEFRGYSGKNNTDAFVIRPADKRIMDLWKGQGEIQLSVDESQPYNSRDGVFGLPSGRKYPLKITLNLNNQRSERLNIVSAFLDVEQSQTDLQPAVDLKAPEYFSCEDDTIFRSALHIENYGWGPLEDAKVTLSFADATRPTKLTGASWNQDLGTVKQTAIIDVANHLTAAGVNVTALKRLGQESLPCSSNNVVGCFSHAVKSGLFGTLTDFLSHDDFFLRLGVAGLLSYKWRDIGGTVHERSSPFGITLTLASLLNASECEGASASELGSGANKALDLKLDKSGYRLPFDLRANVSAGRIGRYMVKLRAPKSSWHKFQIVLIVADGEEIRSRPIDLLYFVAKQPS